MDGFLELRTAADLLEKLRHDLRLLEQEPMDTYRAFNFFVTAEHMVDWFYPGRLKEAQRRSLRSSSPLLEICSHLANGMKHFRAEAKHHQSVSGAIKSKGVWGDAFGEVWGSVFGRGITIELEGTARQQYGDTIDVVALARQILQYWEKEIS